jgi:hypothetical protein
LQPSNIKCPQLELEEIVKIPVPHIPANTILYDREGTKLGKVIYNHHDASVVRISMENGKQRDVHLRIGMKYVPKKKNRNSRCNIS